MKKAAERRHFWRSVFHSPVHLSTQGRSSLARLLDVSLKGALLEVDATWQGAVGQKCQLRLDLAADTSITMQATVAHVEGSHLGLHCDGIDLDSITHLRQLVELNSGDPYILDRDLANLVGKKAHATPSP